MDKAKALAAHRVGVARKNPYVPQWLSDTITAAVLYEPDGSYYVRDSATGRENEKKHGSKEHAINDLAQRWAAQWATRRVTNE
jgi:hypothetical protein